MADQSKFSSFNKKFLCRILLELEQTEFNFQNPYSDYISDSEGTLRNVMKKYVSDSIEEIDCEFFAKLYLENEELLKEIFSTKNFSLAESIVIPKSKTFLVDYWLKEDLYTQFSFLYDIDSYDKNWAHDSFMSAYDEGNISLWDGEEYDKETLDSEFRDWNITGVTEKREKNLEENQFTKTKKLISRLDKKTLLELREMIDKKLMND